MSVTCMNYKVLFISSNKFVVPTCLVVEQLVPLNSCYCFIVPVIMNLNH